MTTEQNLTHRNRAIEFLKSPVAERSSQLEVLGLLRYAKLLTQMGVSEGNIECIERFFSQPSRAKFPQLMETDLQGLDLRGVNFIRANLSGANLAGCCFQDADLIFGNFSGANLTRANLCGATLNETIWRGANVCECDFRETIGLTTLQVRELRRAGGIFEE